MRKAGLLLVILILLGGGLAVWQSYSYYRTPLPLTESQVVTVEHGATLRSIGEQLKEKGAIPAVNVFVMWARVFGHDKKLKTGEYELPAGTSMAGLFEILRSGKSIGYPITVPEGTNMYDIALIVERSRLGKAAEFLRLANDRAFVTSLLGEEAVSLEGYLFPDTYYFTKVDGTKLIVKSMVERFLDRYSQVQPREGWTRNQIVTLASIIEKETGAPFERRRISSVFHNRLEKGMRLQTDPTVLYGKVRKLGTAQINITRADLTEDNPYNTYTRKGLPPGPISNPGVEAMQAAVDPEPTAFLYFVSKNDGTHEFSMDYAGHNKAVGAFQKNAKARKGKSWRDLKKKPKK